MSHSETWTTITNRTVVRPKTSSDAYQTVCDICESRSRVGLSSVYTLCWSDTRNNNTVQRLRRRNTGQLIYYLWIYFTFFHTLQWDKVLRTGACSCRTLFTHSTDAWRMCVRIYVDMWRWRETNSNVGPKYWGHFSGVTTKKTALFGVLSVSPSPRETGQKQERNKVS